MCTGERVTKQKIIQYIPLFIIIGLLTFLIIIKIGVETSKQTITLYISAPKTTIYLNGIKKTETKKPNEEIVLSPKTGEYFVIATRDDSWPWQKNFNLQQGEHYFSSVFTIKKSPMYSLIPEYTLEDKNGIQNNTYKKIAELFKNKQTTQISSNGFVSIELTPDNQNILASWLKDEDIIPQFFCKENLCKKTFFILPTPQMIRQISFYPSRDDRIIFSSDTTIWIIELDRNKVQNAQPLYTGKSPEFAYGPGNNLYVKDLNSIMLINL